MIFSQKTKRKKKNKLKILFLAVLIIFIFSGSNLKVCLAERTWQPSDAFGIQKSGWLYYLGGWGLTDYVYDFFTGHIKNNWRSMGQVIKDTATDGFLWVFNWILFAVWWVLAWFIGIAGLLFDWAIDANNLKAIIHNEGIYDAWKIVRDFLNLGFILVLLFSAFSTVFQIEKYHLKKILLMLVLMALLVNFSFPISRFIIDSSNMTMYYLLNQRFSDESRSDSISSKIMYYSNITRQFVPNISKTNANYTKQILIVIIFTFILMITLASLAAIMVVRIFALALLIIFSSVGFVAAILPSAESFSSKWWDNLFKYSFVGPTMIFMLIISFRMMDSLGGSELGSAINQLKTLASDYDPVSGEIAKQSIADAAYFFLPIVLLWASILVAQSMGVYGASAVVNTAGRVKSWGAKYLTGYSLAKWGVKTLPKKAVQSTGVPGGVKQRWLSFKDRLESKQKSREARVAARLGDKTAKRKDMLRRADEYEKEHIIDDELKNRAKKGDNAAAYALANRGKMDRETYLSVQDKIKDKEVLDIINGKVKEKRIDLVVDYKVNNPIELSKARNQLAQIQGVEPGSINDEDVKEYIVREEIGNLSPEQFAGQNWKGINTDISRRGNEKLADTIKEVTEKTFDEMSEDAKKRIRSNVSANQAKVLRKEFAVIV